MHSIRDLRRRIRSISSTAQITKAMQMVAASKMRNARQGTIAGRPFVHLLYRIQREATTRMAEFHHPLLDVREVRKRAIILIGADKGLCGALIHKPCPKSQGRASAASSKFVKSQ
jgi:F-type H+-transporting ATPase subunit gamma